MIIEYKSRFKPLYAELDLLRALPAHSLNDISRFNDVPSWRYEKSRFQRGNSI